jgi:hypothetical protein
VKTVSAYATTLGKEYTAAELSQELDNLKPDMDIDESLLGIVYYTYFADGTTGAQAETMTAGDFLNFLADDVVHNKAFDAYIDDELRGTIGALQKFADKSTLTQAMNYEQIASFFGIDENLAQQLCLLFMASHSTADNQQLNIQNFVDFMLTDVLSNEALAAGVDPRMAHELGAAKLLIDAVVSEKPYTAQELASTLGALSDTLDTQTMELLYLYYFSINNSTQHEKLALLDLFHYLTNELVHDPRFDALFDDALRANLSSTLVDLDDAAAQLKGQKYSRMILSTTLPGESPETTEFFVLLNAWGASEMSQDYHLIGSAAMDYEMQQSFDAEMLFITILTAIAIFIVVALTFRSLLIPALLVLIIQCGVFVTVSIIGLQGYKVYYLALLIVQCILMGATIDYGILFTNYYKEKRRSMALQEALAEAYHGSIHTILTSGLIMIFITGILGFCFENPIIGQICQTICMGVICATVLIICILPGVLAAFDPLLQRTRRNTDKRGNG